MPTRSRAATYARRRKRRMGQVEHDLSDVQWTRMKQEWGGCAYCRALEDSLQKDCVLPISRGGRYTATNVVPACRSCNASKCNAEVTTWMRRKKLDEQQFLVRWHHVVAVVAALTTTSSYDDPSPQDA